MILFIVCDGGVRKIAEVAKIQCKFFLLYKRLVKCNLKMDSEKGSLKSFDSSLWIKHTKRIFVCKPAN